MMSLILTPLPFLYQSNAPVIFHHCEYLSQQAIPSKGTRLVEVEVVDEYYRLL